MQAMTSKSPETKRGKDRGSLLRAALHADTVAAACREIEAAIAAGAPAPDLARLAQRTGYSAWHFHRVFKAATGITPKAYAAGVRAGRVRGELGHAGSVTGALHDAGYQSTARFYAQAGAVLGMKPAAYRKGGADTDIRFAIGQTSLGAILVAASSRGVCAISLGEDPDALARELQDRFPRARLTGGDAAFERLVAQVVALVEHPDNAAATKLPLDVRGTAFQQRVWQALRRIPAGRTLSYTELAARIGAPNAVRAVASACAANTLAIAIPCHRVVRNDGALAGYRWGVERKRSLLDREALKRK